MVSARDRARSRAENELGAGFSTFKMGEKIFCAL
jgi:hypothetical protein